MSVEGDAPAAVVHDEQCDQDRAKREACFCGASAATSPGQLMTQLSWARMQYQERVEQLCASAGRPVVEAALALLPQGPVETKTHEEEKRFQLTLWLARDEHAQAARKVIADGGIYCVYHGGDMRRCPPGSHT